jgi:hypothetical protein
VDALAAIDVHVHAEVSSSGSASLPGEGAVSAVVDFTIEVEGGTRPACVAQAIYRYYA